LGLNVCASTDETLSLIKCARLKVGIITETFGI
jgi:hypothetical protein